MTVVKFIFLILITISSTGKEEFRCFYNPLTVISTNGVIVEIENLIEENFSPLRAIFLSSTGDTFLLQLAPEWFIKPPLKEGDSISVIGSLNVVDSVKIILPCKIVKGKKEYLLRDETGFPLWRLKKKERR